MWQGLIDQQIKTPMGMTAENLAEKYNISADDCNQFAFRSQQRWKQAHDAGAFQAEMAPIEVKTKKGKVCHFYVFIVFLNLQLLHVCVKMFKPVVAYTEVYCKLIKLFLCVAIVSCKRELFWMLT